MSEPHGGDRSTGTSAGASLSRRLVRDFVVYGGGEIALRATGFVMLPIYTRLLAADEYGAWGFMTTAVGLLSALLVLGGDTAYSRFFFEAKTDEDRQTLASTWFLFLGIWTVVWSIVLAVSRDRSRAGSCITTRTVLRLRSLSCRRLSAS